MASTSDVPKTTDNVHPDNELIVENKSVDTKNNEPVISKVTTQDSQVPAPTTTVEVQKESPEAPPAPSPKDVAIQRLTELNNVKVAQLVLPKVSEKPILVTGAGGWIASHTIYQLLDKGYKVRGTVRDVNGKKYEFLKTKEFHPLAVTNVELVKADLLQAEGWDEAVKGVEYVLHLASPFTYAAKNEEKEVVKPAVQGVENVYAAVLKNNFEIKRIVHTSSIVSVVMGHDNSRYAPMIDKKKKPTAPCATTSLKQKLSSRLSKSSSLQAETTAPPTVDTKTETETKSETETKAETESKIFSEEDWSVLKNISGYEKSKTMAEMRAWEIIKAHNDSFANPENHIDLVVINPAFVFGPLLAPVHTDGESSTQIKRLMDRVYPFLPEIESEHVDVRDVANAHIRGMELPSAEVSGKRFLLAANDGRLRFTDESQILKNSFSAFGYNPPMSTAPSFLFSVGKFFMKDAKAAADKIGKGTPVTTANAQNILKMEKWISAEDALLCHALTMIKFGGVHVSKDVPKSLLDSYTPY